MLDEKRNRIANKAKLKLIKILEESEDIPFLRTCPKCKTPLRSNDHKIDVALHSVDGNKISDNISYYCTNHSDNMKKPPISDLSLCPFKVVLTIRIIESSPDIEPEDREIEVIDKEVELPDSFNL